PARTRFPYTTLFRSRIEAFRKQTSPADVRLRSLTLEDFGADVPTDALVESVLGRFMDLNRLDRAKRIDSKDVEISRDGNSILARDRKSTRLNSSHGS